MDLYTKVYILVKNSNLMRLKVWWSWRIGHSVFKILQCSTIFLVKLAFVIVIAHLVKVCANCGFLWKKSPIKLSWRMVVGTNNFGCHFIFEITFSNRFFLYVKLFFGLVIVVWRKKKKMIRKKREKEKQKFIFETTFFRTFFFYFYV